MERVLVVFQATKAKTENMALAFGLGAVEGGANIRLRHLAGTAPTVLEHQGYGRIKDEDIEWAQVIGLGIEAPEPVDELVALVSQIKAHQKDASIPGKWVYVFGGTTRTQSISFIEDALRAIGLSLVEGDLAEISDDPQYLKSVGRKLADSPHLPGSSKPNLQ